MRITTSRHDNLFYELDSDSEEGNDQQDFRRPLQCSDLPNQLSKPNLESLEEMSSLEVTKGINLPLGAKITGRVRVVPATGKVFAGMGTVWENPTRGLPDLNPRTTRQG